MMPASLAQVSAVFANPALAAAGLGAVSIPIAIHLLTRLRRRQQLWAAMRFLMEAYRRQRRRIQLEQLLLLAVRCLLLAVLALALGGLALGALAGLLDLERGGRVVCLVIDDGLSTRAQTAGQVRFESLRAAALEVVGGLRPDDRLGVWRAGEPAQALVGLPAVASVDRNAVRQRIETLKPRYGGGDLVEALRLVQASVADADRVGPGDEVEVVIVSDFSGGSMDLGAAVPPELRALGERARLVAARPSAPASNVQIAALVPRRRMVLASSGVTGSGGVPVEVKLRRFAATDAGDLAAGRIRVLTEPGGVLLGEATFEHRWATGQRSTSVSVQVPLEDRVAAVLDGAGRGRTVVVEAALDSTRGSTDALSEDNRRLATVRLRRQLDVALVHAGASGERSSPAPSQWLRLALAPQDMLSGTSGLAASASVDVTDVAPDQVTSERLGEADAVMVLRPDLISDAAVGALSSFAEAGGLVWVFMPPVDQPATWADPLVRRLGTGWRAAVETSRPEGSEADQPEPAWRLRLAEHPPTALSLLSGDWEDLLRPVRVMRALAVDPGRGTEAVWLSTVDGPPLLLAEAVGSGTVLMTTAALDPSWTNLATKPLFVPLVHETVRSLLGSSGVEDAVVGRSVTLGGSFSGLDRLEEATQPGRSMELEPAGSGEGGGAVVGTPVAPGLYVAASGGGDAKLAVNVPADAGDTTAPDRRRLENWLSSLGVWRWMDEAAPARGAVSGERSANVGRYLLWAVLLLALLETALARWVSHAHRGDTSRWRFPRRGREGA